MHGNGEQGGDASRFGIAGDKVGGKKERIYTLERRVETPRSD